MTLTFTENYYASSGRSPPSITSKKTKCRIVLMRWVLYSKPISNKPILKQVQRNDEIKPAR